MTKKTRSAFVHQESWDAVRAVKSKLLSSAFGAH